MVQQVGGLAAICLGRCRGEAKASLQQLQATIHFRAAKADIANDFQALLRRGACIKGRKRADSLQFLQSGSDHPIADGCAGRYGIESFSWRQEGLPGVNLFLLEQGVA